MLEQQLKKAQLVGATQPELELVVEGFELVARRAQPTPKPEGLESDKRAV